MRIDLATLNEQERKRALRDKPLLARPSLPRQLPPIFHVFVLAAGAVVTITPALAPWGALVGVVLVAAGGYGLGLAGTPGLAAVRDAARVERLTDVVSIVALRGGHADAPGPRRPRARKAGRQLHRTSRVPHRRQPNLRALAGGAGAGAASLDDPLDGELADFTEGNA